MEDGDSKIPYGNNNMNTVRDISKEILDFYAAYDLQVAGKINNHTAFEMVAEIEENFPVDSIELSDGTRIWNLLRIFFYSNFQKTNGAIGMDINSLKNLPHILKESLREIKINKGVEIYGFSGTENRRVKDGTFYDIYMDPLYDILDDKLSVFEWPTEIGYRRRYNGKIYSKNYIPFSLSTKTLFKIGVSKLLGRRKFTIKNENNLIDIMKFFGKTASVDYDRLKKDVYGFIATFIYVKKFLFNLLQKHRPKAVLMRCGYGRFHMALSQACRELNIPSIELQHGLITKYHIGYVKERKSDDKDCLPEYLLTYGEAFSSIVRKGNIFDEKKVISVGFPYLEEIILSSVTLDAEIKKFLDKFDNSILFTSQWILADEIKKFVIELSKKLKKKMPNVCIIFKPHPNDSNDYADMRYSNIFVAHKYSDTYKILKSVDIHSTVYSTTGLESLAFGKPNIFIDTRKIYKKFDERGVYVVKTTEQFIEKLEHIISNYKNTSKEAKKISEKFFKPNAKKNIANFLNSIGINTI